ncbi:MAG: sel1 repeat family protein [Solobacterium sp.]|nr:sel1 repeat family protein [Solobacterium sp.]
MKNQFDPFAEMHAYYRLDDPSAEEQFRFVEAMKYLIATAYPEDDREAYCFNLAMYYRDIREFRLEKKYLEIAAEYGSDVCMEELGIIWYYGLDGVTDYERAYHCFKESGLRRGEYMLADMYRLGQYVEKDLNKCREILGPLFEKVLDEADYPFFRTSTLFPEIALRMVQTDRAEGLHAEYHYECLALAAEFLAARQQNAPFWGNISLMREILETSGKIYITDAKLPDIYSLLVCNVSCGTITFVYNSTVHTIDIFMQDAKTVWQYENKWYQGAEDFLERARINGRRITTDYDLIEDLTLSLRK